VYKSPLFHLFSTCFHLFLIVFRLSHFFLLANILTLLFFTPPQPSDHPSENLPLDGVPDLDHSLPDLSNKGSKQTTGQQQQQQLPMIDELAHQSQLLQAQAMGIPGVFPPLPHAQPAPPGLHGGFV